jgi:hypothetical protein
MERLGNPMQVFLDLGCKFHENALLGRGRHSMG